MTSFVIEIVMNIDQKTRIFIVLFINLDRDTNLRKKQASAHMNSLADAPQDHLFVNFLIFNFGTLFPEISRFMISRILD